MADEQTTRWIAPSKGGYSASRGATTGRFAQKSKSGKAVTEAPKPPKYPASATKAK